MTHVIRAETSAGDRFELHAVPADAATARKLATRAASLLGAVGAPSTWRGGRVSAVAAGSGRLVAVCRVPRRKAVAS